MKKITLFLISCFIVMVSYSQSDTTIIFNGNKIVITQDNENVSVFVEKIEPGINVPDSTSTDSIPPYIVDEYVEDPFYNDSIEEPDYDYNFGDRFLNPD